MTATNDDLPPPPPSDRLRSVVLSRCQPGQPFKPPPLYSYGPSLGRAATGTAIQDKPVPAPTFEEACVRRLLQILYTEVDGRPMSWYAQFQVRYRDKMLDIPGVAGAGDVGVWYDRATASFTKEKHITKLVTDVWPRLSKPSKGKVVGKPLSWSEINGVLFVARENTAEKLGWELRYMRGELLKASSEWFRPGEKDRHIYVWVHTAPLNLRLASMAFTLQLLNQAFDRMVYHPRLIDMVHAHFLSFVAREWTSTSNMRSNLLKLWGVPDLGKGTLDKRLQADNWDVISFTLRCMSRSPPRRSPRQDIDGFQCLRRTGSLPCPGLPGNLHSLTEVRFSAVMIRRLRPGNAGQWQKEYEKPLDGLVIVLNDMPTGEGIDMPRTAPAVQPGDKAHGAVFMRLVLDAIDDWNRNWIFVLDMIEDMLRVEVEDILTKERRQAFMFDTSFQRSELYFSILQLLRIFTDWINQTMHDVDVLTVHLLRAGRYGIAEADVQGLRAGTREAVDALLARIQSKAAEVSSLRDGLFNATSLREASRSTTMNRYIIVFTVMTILYLPPTFVSTVFGIDGVFSPEPNTSFTAFTNITVIVSIITYIAALLLIIFVDRRNISQSVRNRIAQVVAMFSHEEEHRSEETRGLKRRFGVVRQPPQVWTEEDLVKELAKDDGGGEGGGLRFLTKRTRTNTAELDDHEHAECKV